MNFFFYIFSTYNGKRHIEDQQIIFRRYLCYGLGFPVLMTFLIFIANETEAFPERYRPNFGNEKRCYFESKLKLSFRIWKKKIPLIFYLYYSFDGTSSPHIPHSSDNHSDYYKHFMFWMVVVFGSLRVPG